MVIRERMKKGLRYGQIVDFLVHRQDRQTLKALLLWTYKYFKKKNVDIISFIQPTDNEILVSLRKLGLVLRHGMVMGGYNNLQGVQSEYLEKSSRWFITQADSDIDIT